MGVIKKLAVICALPFVWLGVFSMIGYFDITLFVFVSIASAMMGLLNKGWGVLSFVLGE